MQKQSQLLPGVFTVNAEGKKVRFSRGNIFWTRGDSIFDTPRFDMEKNQYDYPKTRKKKHIGHFFWSKDAAVARAASYSDPSATASDILFAADGGAIEGWTVLTAEEWKYLISHNMPTKDNVMIAGINCAILVPDGLSVQIKPEYTASEWTAAEADGLVAIPYAGYYNAEGVNIYDNFMGYLLTATPLGFTDYGTFASYIVFAGKKNSLHRHFGISIVELEYYYPHNTAAPIRLVKIIN